MYTDHKNLTASEFKTTRVRHWRLLMEEYGPEIIYIKGEDNKAADAMSRLPFESSKIENPDSREQLSEDEVADHYGVDSLPQGTFPLRYKIIDEYQKKDKELVAALEKGRYTAKTFRGGGKEYLLLVKGDKIVIPEGLHKYVMDWYHTYLLHPGRDCTLAAIGKHLYWWGYQEDIRKYIEKCDTCQRCKKRKLKYRELPPKEAEATP